MVNSLNCTRHSIFVMKTRKFSWRQELNLWILFSWSSCFKESTCNRSSSTSGFWLASCRYPEWASARPAIILDVFRVLLQSIHANPRTVLFRSRLLRSKPVQIHCSPITMPTDIIHSEIMTASWNTIWNYHPVRMSIYPPLTKYAIKIYSINNSLQFNISTPLLF